METIKLGDQVKDSVTEFVGMATERCEYLNGCVQIRVTPKIDPKKPNEIPDGFWIDIEQLEVIEPKLQKAPIKRRNGGSTRNAPNHDRGKR